MNETKRFAVSCTDGNHVANSFDEEAEAKKITSLYVAHKLACEFCGCTKWQYRDTKAK